MSEFEKQKQFNSLDFQSNNKQNNNNINIFKNQYNEGMDESMCSFQSRVNNDDNY